MWLDHCGTWSLLVALSFLASAESGLQNVGGGSGGSKFVCRDEGYHEDPRDCTIYYRCVDFGDGKPLVKFKFDCGPGTVFSKLRGDVCTHPHESGRKECGDQSDKINDIDSNNAQETEKERPGVHGKPESSPPPVSATCPVCGPTNAPGSQGTTASVTPRPVYPTKRPPTTAGWASSTANEQTQGKPNVGTQCTCAGFMADPQDCTKFYRCVDEGNGSYRRYEFNCGEGTVWDLKTETCNHPWAANRQGCTVPAGPGASHGPSQGSGSTGTTPSFPTSPGYPNEDKITVGPVTTESVGQGPDGSTGKPGSGTSKPSEGYPGSGNPTGSPGVPPKPDGDKPPSKEPNFGTECTCEGFMADPQDCKKFYRCVDDGKGSYTKFDFTCGEGTVWDPKIDSCNHAWAANRVGCTVSEGQPQEPSQSPGSTGTTPGGPSGPGSSGGPSGSDNNCTDGTTGSEQVTQSPDSGDSSTLPTGDSSTDQIPSGHPGSSGTSPGDSSGTPPDHGSSGYPGTEGSGNPPNHGNQQPNIGTECTCAGFMADPKDCTKFYRCVDEGNGSYKRYEFNCGEGTVWDPKLDTCNHPWAANREGCTVPTGPGSSQGPSDGSGSTEPNVDGTPSSGGQEGSGSETPTQKPTQQPNEGPGSSTNAPSDSTSNSPGDSSSGTPGDSSTGSPGDSSSGSPGDSSTGNTSKPGGSESNTQKPNKPNIGTECICAGFMADPQDCTKFYRCVDEGNGSYRRYEFTCGPGTVWDPTIDTCNHPWAANRVGCTVPQGPSEGTEPSGSLGTTGSPGETQTPPCDTSTAKPDGQTEAPEGSSQAPGEETSTVSSEGPSTPPSEESSTLPAEGSSEAPEGSTEVPSEGSTSAPEASSTLPPSEGSTEVPSEAPPPESSSELPPSESSSEMPPSEASTEAPAEASTAVPTEAPTEVPAEASTESPTEAATETPESSSEAPTEGASETPPEASSELPPEVSTEVPPEGSTEVSSSEASPEEPTTVSSQPESSEKPPTTGEQVPCDKPGSGTQTPGVQPPGTQPGGGGSQCTEEGFFPNEQDCTKFYRCVNTGSSYTKYDFSCGPGTAWDQSLLTCNYIAQVSTCKGNSPSGKPSEMTTAPESSSESSTSESSSSESSSTSSSSSSGSSSTEESSGSGSSGPPGGSNQVLCEREGFFPNPRYCNKFYRCVDNGKGFNVFFFDCAPGTIFDPSISVCNHPSAVYPPRNCGEQNGGASTPGQKPGGGCSQQTTPSSGSQCGQTKPSTEATPGENQSTEGSTEPGSVAPTSEPGEASSENSTPSSGESTSPGEETTEEAGSSPTDGGESTGAPPTGSESSEVPPSTGTVSCPVGNLTGEQVVLVCPTGFKRHSKYCNVFYQCSTDSDMQVKVLSFHCPENTIFDDKKVQCVPEDQASEPCDGIKAGDRVYRRVESSSTSMVKVEQRERLCPGEGYYPYNKEECRSVFYKCKRDSNDALQGYLYKCSDDFVFWTVSRRCERAARLPMCADDKKSDDSAWESRWQIPVEKYNRSARKNAA